MGYITGTLSDANPGATIYALIETELLAEGYVLADTVVIGPLTHKIWRNPAANNPSAQDYYLDIFYNTAGAGTVRFQLFEDYNATTKQMIRMATYASSVDATYRSYQAAGLALESTNPARIFLTTSTASFGYWILVTNKAIVSIGSVDPTYMGYLGLYDPYPEYAAAAGDLLLPLVSARMVQGTSQPGGGQNPLGLTRIPPQPAGNGAPYSFVTQSALPQLSSTQVRLPTGNSIFGGGFVAADIEIVMPVPTSPARFGTLYDVAILPVDATIARGDTVSIDGNTWVLGSADNFYAHAMRTNA